MDKKVLPDFLLGIFFRYMTLLLTGRNDVMIISQR
jgi:hypothetical protein